MSFLNKRYKIKSILLIIVISVGIFHALIPGSAFSLIDKDNKPEVQLFDLFSVKFSDESFLNWKEQIIKADKNENGLSDVFEAILKDSAELGSFRGESGKRKIKLDDNLFGNQYEDPSIIPLDNIPIIVYFPEGDYSPISLFFEDLEGRIKASYKAAVNGFAGSISLNALSEFCDSLRQFNIPFFIEEDKIYQAQLYYASKNMNLRPYVWNNLSYDGDEYSSIAIVDTGVDDSHNFFSPGYPSKIVGWRDEVNFSSSPYDDNGHGSHTSGIALGIGSPSYDVNGSTVATAAYNFNYTGWDILPRSYEYDWTRFNVTDTGVIELFCEFDDFTPDLDDVNLGAYLYYGNTIVDSYEVGSDSWSQILSYTATNSSLGMYSFGIVLDLIDGDPDGYVSDFNARFRSEIHWPFDPPQFGSGDPWKGVAPDANLVGVKVLDQYGYGLTSTIISGIDWVITNKMVYNITTMSLSLGGESSDTALVSAVNKVVENGIVTVVSAGNSGPGDNLIGSPGDAKNVITVAAMSIDDHITDYSSQGGQSEGWTTKPDITAPGGSFNNLQMFSTDTNDNDAMPDLLPNPALAYLTDRYANDMEGAQGTSMSAPLVAGASNLLIEAMGGHQSWGYTATEAKRIKALLLMTATETYPLLRETYSSVHSPVLNRGGKDVHEGYGRLNVDVAIEACTKELNLGSQYNAWITSSLIDPFNKHGLGCYVNLNNGQNYEFTLDVPSGADFDLHLYSDNPSGYLDLGEPYIGEPILVASSTSTELGTDEVISFTPTTAGKYYLIAKAISGEGNAVISYPMVDHDISVSLEVPSSTEIGNTYIINATVFNTGINVESDVDLFLSLDGGEVNSTTILSFLVGANKTINYTWTPVDYGSYNFTAYAPAVTSETIIVNNIVTKIVSPLTNYIMVPDYTYTYVSHGPTAQWHLDDDDFIDPSVYKPLPFDFQFYDETFSNVYVSSNGWLSFVNPAPTSMNNIPFPTDLPDYHYMIAPFWDDLLPHHVKIRSLGTYWVVEWEDIKHWSSGATVGSFQVVLYETGEIAFNYDYINYTGGGYTCGLNLGVDTQYFKSYQGLTNLTDDFSILFTPRSIWEPIFSEDFESGLSKWETITGLWNLTDDTSIWPAPYNSPTHSMWFGNESTGDYDTGFREMGELISYPIDLSSFEDFRVLLEFYHWREGEGNIGRDVSFVNISTDGVNWDVLYQSSSMYIPPWEKISLDISRYAGNSSVQLKFAFDTFNEITNIYRGWLVDDIEILGTPLSLNITTPDSTSFWETLTTRSINWTSTGSIPYVKIELYKGGVFELEIFSVFYLDIANDGELSWTIPSGLTDSTQYQIKITAVSNPATSDFSDYFEIFNPTLTITTPDSHTAWETDTSQYITWTPKGTISNVKIELYKGGVFDMEIAASTPNDGSYSWTIPTGLSDSKLYQINITDVTNPVTGDVSDDFEIFTPLTITAPDSDSTWETGTSQHITWNPKGATSNVKIELYKGGAFELEIVASTPNDGFYSWTIPIGLSNSNLYQINITDVTNSTTSNVSDHFEIFNPTLTITTPNSGTAWATGDFQYITWTLKGTISIVRIELYKEGVFELVIEASTYNDGSYSWRIPTGLSVSNLYQINITDATNPTTGDVSDYFEIFNPTLTITTPDSDTAWETDTSQYITWTSRGTISIVKIELYKGGVFEMEIEASTSNDGSYNWDIPTDLEDAIDYQIKISDVSNLATSEDSDYFAITRPSGPPSIPGYNIYLVIATICILSIILTKNRIKKA